MPTLPALPQIAGITCQSTDAALKNRSPPADTCKQVTMLFHRTAQRAPRRTLVWDDIRGQLERWRQHMRRRGEQSVEKARDAIDAACQEILSEGERSIFAK